MRKAAQLIRDSNGDSKGCHKCACDVMASDVHLRVPGWAVDFGFVAEQLRVAVVRDGVGATS